MPAILIETSFISNKRECKRLTSPKYQDNLCDGIIKGIRAYIREINPTASVKRDKDAGGTLETVARGRSLPAHAS